MSGARAATHAQVHSGLIAGTHRCLLSSAEIEVSKFRFGSTAAPGQLRTLVYDCFVEAWLRHSRQHLIPSTNPSWGGRRWAKAPAGIIRPVLLLRPINFTQWISVELVVLEVHYV